MCDTVEVCLPQIAWHTREAIQSVDTSSTTNLLATGGNDNEVRLWRVSSRGVTFVQSLAGHTKVRLICPSLRVSRASTNT